jgi:hypothetical protein
MTDQRENLNKKIKTDCWDYWIGKDVAIAKCMCCELSDMRIIDFDCGHVLSKANGGLHHINNLRPICPACNKSMKKLHMAVFKFKYGYGILKGFTEDQILELMSPKLNSQPEVSQPEVSQPEVSQPEVSQPEVSQPEVSQPEVSQPEVSQEEIPKPNTCMFWEKGLIKKILPKLIQIPLKKYTGIDLTISEEELHNQMEEDLKGLYEPFGYNAYKRIL